MTPIIARIVWMPDADIDTIDGYSSGFGRHMVTVTTRHTAPDGRVVTGRSYARTADILLTAAPEVDGQYALDVETVTPRRRVGPDRMLPNTSRGLASTPPTRN